jgi:hypothetical protein
MRNENWMELADKVYKNAMMKTVKEIRNEIRKNKIKRIFETLGI